MKRRQFEEILDECISAYLSGKRSVEQSLSLYPSIARELEPLLRAAADTADTLQQFHPPPHVQERIRQRILRTAGERAAARALTREVHGFEPRRHRAAYWLVGLPAVAAATAAIVVAGLFLLSDSSSDSTRDTAGVSIVERPEFASNLEEARRQLSALQVKTARGEHVTATDLDALMGATRRLAETAEVDGLGAGDQAQAEAMLEQQVVLLGQLASENEEHEEIEQAVAVTVSVAAALGVSVGDAGSDGDVTPANSPSATPSPSPATASPTPSSSPAPSQVPPTD